MQVLHIRGEAARSAVHSRAMNRRHLVIIYIGLVSCGVLRAAPTTRPAEGKLPHLQVDVPNHQIRVECEAVNPEEKLEFLVCSSGTKEYESVLRSRAPRIWPLINEP